MTVLAIVDDLFFRAKIEAAAAQMGAALKVATDADGGPWRLIIIDLNLSTRDPVELVKTIRTTAPSTPIVGYYSHVQVDLETRAKHAGCSMVLPRSAFVKQLPALLQMPDGLTA